MLEKRGEKRKLIIVGNADNFKTSDRYVKRLIESGSLSQNIIFTGYISDEELKNLIKHASMLIQPSIYEGFGIPPLESLFLGTPVLISDIPVFREIYEGFPVEYFACNNSHDLYEKIKNSNPEPIALTTEQKGKFTYEKSANIILNTIKQFLINKGIIS